MFKRVGLFLLVNILVMIVGATAIMLLMSVFGLEPYVTSRGINYTTLMIICLVWGMAGSFISLAMSKFMAKRMFGIQMLEANGQYGELVRKVHAYARQAGLEKEPEVGIYQSPEVNAFATGMTRNKSMVAVSTGLVNILNDEEAEGVLAHEVSHIANGDMVTMALVQGVVNAFVLFLSRLATIAIDNFLRQDDEGEGLGFFAYILLNSLFQIIFGLLASPVVFAFSRWREYRADAGGARLAGKEKMIAALEALKRTYDRLDSHGDPAPHDSSVRTMQINDKIRFSEIFSTHPTLDKRIDALRRLSDY